MIEELELDRWPRPVKTKDESEIRRRFRVEYDLAYDGGGSKWNGYYRTRLGARLAIIWNRHIASWGGTAVLFDRQPWGVPKDITVPGPFAPVEAPPANDDPVE